MIMHGLVKGHNPGLWEKALPDIKEATLAIAFGGATNLDKFGAIYTSSARISSHRVEGRGKAHNLQKASKLPKVQWKNNGNALVGCLSRQLFSACSELYNN
jgi:hypothetical protein